MALPSLYVIGDGPAEVIRRSRHLVKALYVPSVNHIHGHHEQSAYSPILNRTTSLCHYFLVR